MKKLLKLFGCNNRRKKNLKENDDNQKEITTENYENNEKIEVNEIKNEDLNNNNKILPSTSIKNEEEEEKNENNNDNNNDNNNNNNDNDNNNNDNNNNNNNDNNNYNNDNNNINDNINDNNENYSSSGLITKSLDITNENENLILTDSKLILDYERDKIKFTKKGFVDFFKTLEQLDNYKNYWNKENLTIDIRFEGSPISNKFCLIKTFYFYYKKDLNENLNLLDLIKFQYDVNLRKKWDKAFKNIEKIEGNENVFIVSSWAKSPIFLISEREGIEKRFIFKYDDCYYVCSTSVPSDYIPLKKNVVRIENYINFFKIYEDNEKFYLLTINQSDFKMAIPQMILNVTLPTTSKSWFNNLKKFANKVVKNNGEYLIEEENENDDEKNNEIEEKKEI
jgi:hypothetical protein